MQKIPRRLREQLMPLYSSLYPSLKESFSFGKPYSSIDSFTVAKNQFKYLEKYFTFTQLRELIKSMDSLSTGWLKKNCYSIVSNYFSKNSNEITERLQDISFLKNSDKFIINNSTLEKIFEIFSNTIDTNMKFQCIKILLSQKYVSKERLSLALDFLLTNTETSNARKLIYCFDSIRKHLKFYENNFPKEIHSIFNNLSEKCKKEIIELNIDTIHLITGILSYQNMYLMNFDSRPLTNAGYVEFKHKIESNLQQLDEQIDGSSDLIRKIYYGLKCLSCLIDLNRNQKDKVLGDIIELTVHFLNSLFKKKLVFTVCLSYNQIMDLMNVFCLFNKFNIDNFQTEKTKKSLLKLKEHNKTWYDGNRDQMRFSESALILYNFTQMNLNIQNESLIEDMFKKIRSLDALKKKLINMPKVFCNFIWNNLDFLF